MSVSRVLGGVVASVAVAGCAVVVLGMGHSTASGGADRAADAFSMPAAPSSRPTYAALPTPVAATTAAARPSTARTAGVGPAVAPPARAGSPAAGATTLPPTTLPPTTPPKVATSAPAVQPVAKPVAKPVARPVAKPVAPPRSATVVRGVALPLRYPTGSATRVITVTAPSRGRTTATLQAWRKAPGGGWLRYGGAVTAHIGADGMSTHPSESISATPIGSFTLTLAFGRYRDPGTALPYFQTRPSDWWISQSGPLYNTHQRCSSGCRFRQGDPNEHLYYETPFYNYAVVIDYNTRNAPGGVRQGAGSAFFLHVYPAGTGPTAGCVAIPQAKLITLMRWLTPSAHPRILIGVH